MRFKRRIPYGKRKGKAFRALVNYMELIGELIKATQEIAPELLPDCDVRKIPLLYTSAQLKERLKAATDRNVIVFSNYVLELHNDLLAGVTNVLISEIARRIKSAQVIYSVQSAALAKEYPYITGINDTVIFLDEEEGEKYIAQLKEKTTDKVKLKKHENEEIQQYFVTLTRFGIEFVMIEPTLCKLRFHQNQLYKSDFASISGGKLNYAILKFLQGQEGKHNPLAMKGLEAAMLLGIASGTFACMGKTINDNFEAILITDKRDGSKWIPIFTDTAEIQETYSTIPSVAKILMTGETVTTKFQELRKFMSVEQVSGIIINIGGYGLRLEKDKCRKLMGEIGRR